MKQPSKFPMLSTYMNVCRSQKNNNNTAIEVYLRKATYILIKANSYS